ncbi:MAG: hypothetical protein R3F48_13820 [Candidatus Zixiibacteriota bacterium]
MAEEAKTNEQAPAEGQEPKAKGKSKGLMMMIVISVVVFVVAIAGFSFMMGVFSSPEQTAEEGTEGEQTAEVSHDAGKEAKADEPSEDEEYLAEIAKLEQELFGIDDVSQAEDMDDIMALAEEDGASQGGASGMTEKDSIEASKWLESEKAKLAAQRKEIEDKMKELDKQEYRLKQLIAKKNQMQSARVASLAKLYDGMKPDQVAPLIVKLDEEQAVDVLLKMKPGNAAKILGSISPDRAARISSRMITLTEEN